MAALVHVVPWRYFPAAAKQQALYAAAAHDRTTNFHFLYLMVSRQFPQSGIQAYQIAAQHGAVNVVNYYHANRIPVPENVVLESAKTAATRGHLLTTMYYFRRVYNNDKDQGWKLLLAAANHGHSDVVGKLIDEVHLFPNDAVLAFARTGTPAYLRTLDFRVLKHKYGLEIARELARTGQRGFSLANGYGEQSMLIASEFGHAAYLRMLMDEYNLRPCENDNRELTRASQKGNAETVRVLLESRACKADYSDSLALKHAAIRGNLPMVKLLLQYGASPEVSDNIPIKSAIIKGQKCAEKDARCRQAYRDVHYALCAAAPRCNDIKECPANMCPNGQIPVRHPRPSANRVRFNVPSH
jgi:ankyrin repeat protein